MLFSLLSLTLSQTGLAVQASNAPQQELKLEGEGWQVLSGSYEPWTSPPICTSKIEHTTVPDDTLFCLYNQKDFANGRGMVIFSTLQMAEAIVELGLFNTYKSTADAIATGAPPYTSRDISGKGIGLVANRTIFRGERIIMESPVAIYNDQLAQRVDKQHLALLHRQGINQLPTQTREQFLQLHKGTTRAMIDEIDDILLTNAFGSKMLAAGDSHIYLLPAMSRINHACRANHYFFSHKKMTQSVYAMKDILLSEEITISHITPEDPSPSRHQRLAEWGFTCACSLCRQAPDVIHASDLRLHMIAQVKDWVSSRNEFVPDRVGLAELLVALYELEGLGHTAYRPYQLAAFACSAMGYDLKARLYAAKAHDAASILYGAEHEVTRELEVLMLQPEGHDTWMHDYKLRDMV